MQYRKWKTIVIVDYQYDSFRYIDIIRVFNNKINSLY